MVCDAWKNFKRDRKKKKNDEKDAKNKFCKRPMAPGISRQSPIQVLTGPGVA